MTKRKSKNSAVFKPPKKTQSRAKQQKNAEKTNLLSVEANQRTKSENSDSHNASSLDKLVEHQVEKSPLNNIPTAEVPVDPHHSLEEKTSRDDNGEHGNPPEVSHETEQTKPNNSDKSNSLNVDLTNVDQPDTELYDEDSEKASNSNNEYQMLPESDHDGKCQIGIKLSHEEQLGSSDTIAETSVNRTGVQMEDDGSADPVVKRKKRKRMGMCRVGERKRMLKEQISREGQENEVGLDVKEEMSDSKGSISLEKQPNTELEIAANSFPTSCPMEDVPVQQEQPDMQHGNEVQMLVECISSEQEVTNEADPTTNSEAVNTSEKKKTECMEFGTKESNIREDEQLLCSEICKDAVIEPTIKVTKDFEEESTDVSAQELIVREAPLEFLKDTTEALASTSKDGSYLEQQIGSEHCSECDMNACISDQSKELLDIEAHNCPIASPLAIINEIEDQCESLDYTLVAATVTAENSVNCEESSMWSLSSPAAPPRGEDKDVQTVAELDISLSDADKPLLSPVAEHDPSSPLSIHSLTDSQLNNIPLSLEDLPIYKGSYLEDATELVCGLIRDLSAMNQLLMDAHRRIGFAQRSRIPPKQPHRRFYGPPYSDM